MELLVLDLVYGLISRIRGYMKHIIYDKDISEESYKKERSKRKKDIIVIVVLSVLFLTLNIVQGSLARYKSDDIDLYMLFKSIQGVISVVQILIAVIMITISVEGYYISVTLFAVNFVIVVLRTIYSKEIGSIPGIAIALGGAIIMFIIHGYIVNVSNKEKQLYNLAHTDSLTELPNRRALKQHMLEIVKESKNPNHRFAIAMIDLDNFKNINDTIGHDWGDKVLEGISERWKALMTEKDFFARLGGDEFALLVDDYATLTELTEHLNQILGAVRDKFILKGKDYYVSASIGVALYPGDSAEMGQLLKFSDMAMYAAKYQGKKRICFFDSMMNDVIESNVEVEGIVRRAISTDSFTLVFQPQYTTEGKKLRGFETLIRLSDEKGKQVSPGQFIPVAEKSSLIIEVDNWVLQKALTQFKPIVEEYTDLVLSINISATHMLDNDFLKDIDTVLKETQFPVKNLELELTESVFVDSLNKAKEVMHQIKSRGIMIALDDFGTGYSSLSYLKELPIDLLKIDKAFVDSISDGPKEESFVAAIISLGKLMQFKVISEGVEEQYQLDILNNMGCDYIQGFIWGKPMRFEETLRII